MRLQRLNLIRYGHFTDRSLELPQADVDFHIVFGPNEAGKSTALSAIEDLLFGIPPKSPYNFLHDYPLMRIGALVEHGSSSLEIVRKKGNKDTLLDPDESPLAGGEGALAPFLADIDRLFFERMFSLDHGRLRSGGQAILEARDNVGEVLFSAGSGIGGLRERLNALTQEADSLWAPRHSKNRAFYQAEDKFKDAQNTQRDHTLLASKWYDLKRAYEAAEQAHARVVEDHQKVTAERNKVARIRRVYRDVQRKHEIDGEFAALEGTVALPENAAETLALCEQEVSKATTRLNTLSERLEQANDELAALMFDDALIRRAEDIRLLHERRIEIRSERDDLPKREAELNAAEKELGELASELGWADDETASLVGRIPPRTKVSVVRSLLGSRGELFATLSSRTQALEDAEQALASAQARLGDAGDIVDVSSLAAVVKAVREKGDIASRLRQAEKEATDAQARVDRLLAGLHPSISGEQALADAIPARALIQGHRDRIEDWKRRVRENQQQTTGIERDRSDAQEQMEKLARDEQAVSLAELAEVRGRRDTLWELIKLKHIEQQPLPDEERLAFADELDNLAGSYEPAVADADALADKRFDNAAAAGRLAGLVETVAALDTRLAHATEDRGTLEAEGQQLASAWETLWAPSKIEPADPDTMLQWLDRRDEVVAAIEEREAAHSARDVLTAEEREARNQVVAALVALGVEKETIDGDTLAVVLEKAVDVQRRHEAHAARRVELEEAVDEAKANLATRRREQTRAETAWSQWETEWTVALQDLGLAGDVVPAAVEAQIEILDQLRDCATTITTLKRDRIDKINRDIGDFGDVVTQLVNAVAQDLVDTSAEEAVLELERRLEEAERLRQAKEATQKSADQLADDIEKTKAEQREAASSVGHLKDLAGTGTNEELRSAIAKSDELRRVQHTLSDLTQKLEQDGDGLSFEELARECADVDIDNLVAREQSLSDELSDLQTQLDAAVEERTQARAAFQAAGGDDAAAKAAADKQEALAEMAEAAENYVRTRTSAMLLQWAIDRYRQEKQTPLLKRAGALFAILCGGSFAELKVVFDDDDRAELFGVRPNGKLVASSGMSDGTADQLYLALRIASIEDYQKRANSLPFVADDLFINFDDERAAAGFKVLAEMARQSQVLFFTHHQHLVNIAQYTLGGEVRVLRLEENEAVAVA